MLYQSSKIKSQNTGQNSKMEVKYRAFYLSINIINFLESLPYKQSSKIIADQLIRSITSIGANIVEAKSSSSKREFVKYFEVALKSANETKYWLALFKELNINNQSEIKLFIQEVSEIARIIGSSVLTLKGKNSI